MASSAFEIAVEAYITEHGSIDRETMDTLRTVYMVELSGSTKAAAVKARNLQEYDAFDKKSKKEKMLKEIENKTKKFTDDQRRELMKDEADAYSKSTSKAMKTTELALTNNVHKVFKLLKSFMDAHEPKGAYNVKDYAGDGKTYKAWVSTAENVTKLMNSLKDIADNF